jgi:cell division septum initiation protein DivIVA
LEAIQAQAIDDKARAQFEIQEFEVTIETYKAENHKLRQEIAEMSGDDMRNEREDRLTKELEQEKRIALEVENRLKKLEAAKQHAAAATAAASAAIAAAPVAADEISEGGDGSSVQGGANGSGRSTSPAPHQPPRLRTQSSASSMRSSKNLGAATVATLAKEFDLSGRHEASNHELVLLTNMINEMELAHSDGQKVLHWAHHYAESTEKWFVLAEEKFVAFERGSLELGKRIKDLESQRNRLEKDLEVRVEKVCFPSPPSLPIDSVCLCCDRFVSSSVCLSLLCFALR